jgi:hypothetical protein
MGENINFNFNVGDTNFIALVNPNRYNTFVDEDWDLKMLKDHFIKETEQGNILVMQMTDEGIEGDWKVSVEFEDYMLESDYFRKDTGYIKVDNNELCFVEYTCLTMAAQFKDEKVPDKYCEKFRFHINNGLYKVDIIQYYDIDNEKHFGRNDIDIAFRFTEVSKCEEIEPKVFWWNI